MNTRKQVLISGAIVVAALTTVGLYSAIAAPDALPESPQGHDHAAMTAGGGGEAAPVRLDAEAARRIGVTYATAALRPFRREVGTMGSVTYDETRLTSVDPRIEGWVERLYVDFTGTPVRRGQPLMEIYSPMLVTAQEELLLARRLAEDARASGAERSAASADELLDAARRRLRFWGVQESEIAAVERRGTPTRTLTIRSPASGIVVEKSVIEGGRIMPGTELFRIADLSRVWIDGEVFEKDLSLVRLGQSAEVRFEAYPGETFSAVVSYVYPAVSLESRTGRVRLELDNPGLRLMPGMYASVTLASEGEREALMVPRSAVHQTGTRALVFVRHGESLMPHTVTTGLVADGEIEILSGIEAGMQVVSSANFLVDAESSMGGSLGSIPGMDPAAPADAHAGH